MKIISNIDKNHYDLIRKNVSDFILNLSNLYDSEDFIILDVAPEKHLGAKEHFKLATIKTLDIDPNSDANYIADLCNTNTEIIPNDTFN